MTTISAWQIKQFLQSQTPQEHMDDTEANLLRPHVLLSVVDNAEYNNADMGERFLHAYLNDCRTGREKDWYTAMQKGFMQNHSSWSDLFPVVLQARRMSGSKKQKANILGDWMALSQLQGAPLSFDMLAQTKQSDRRQPSVPVQPRENVIITVSIFKDSQYNDVFELLYAKHHAEHNGWQALLQRMNLKNMTPNIWDTYVDLYPDQVEVPVKDQVMNDYAWESLLQQFVSSRHALALNRVVVNMMQNGNANGLCHLLTDDSHIKPNDALHNRHLSEALYETLCRAPDVRQKLSVQHIVHALNTEPTRMKTELDYAVSGKPNAHASRDIVVPQYLDQLTAAVRMHLMSLLGEHSKKYSSVLEALLGQANVSVTKLEIAALLKSSYSKALLVEHLMMGRFTSVATKIAESSAELTTALLAADFRVPHAFERVMLAHLTPEFSYEDAAKLMAIAESLGADDSKLIREMFQTAFDGASSSNSFPIEGLLNDTPSPPTFSI